MMNIDVLREALPYIQRYKGQCFVIKVGGGALREDGARAGLARDLALIQHLGVRLTLVHGGGPQATELSQRLGQDVKLINGRRITDDDTLEVAKMVFAGKINTEMLGALRAQRVAAVGVSGVDGGLIRARRRPPAEITDAATGARAQVDYGHVGDIVGVDTSLLSTLMAKDYLPVVSSLAADDEGRILNVNADAVATALARDLAAQKLIFLTDVPGVLADKDDPASLISHLTVASARAAFAEGRIGGGMIPKLENALRALEDGRIRRVHIMSGTERDALLTEIFTARGAGTLITTAADAEGYRAELEGRFE